ncbi:HU family DNA-binding protein, partial [Parabacteroides sp.]
SDTCECLVEQLLNGNKIKFGELGIFSLSLKSEGAENIKKFTSDNITDVNILFTPGEDFENLRSRATFNPVSSRAAQQATYKAERAGETTVDLEAAKKKPTSGGGSDSESPDEI